MSTRSNSRPLLELQGAAAAAGAHARRRPGVLALLLGLHRPPEGTVHSHANPYWTAELYGKAVLGLRETDICFLGGQAVLRLRTGQRTHLPAQRRRQRAADGRTADPRATFKAPDRRRRPAQADGLLRRPTGFAGMLASPALPARHEVALRLVSSAGEALPAEIGERFKRHFGIDIVDGIGSTEMLHIFMSNLPDRRLLWHHRLAGARLRRSNCGANDGRPVATANPATSTSRAPRRRSCMGQPRGDARHLPGRLDEERRQICP